MSIAVICRGNRQIAFRSGPTSDVYAATCNARYVVMPRRRGSSPTDINRRIKGHGVGNGSGGYCIFFFFFYRYGDVRITRVPKSEHSAIVDAAHLGVEINVYIYLAWTGENKGPAHCGVIVSILESWTFSPRFSWVFRRRIYRAPRPVLKCGHR